MLKNDPFLGQISNWAISGLWFGWGPNPICQGTYPMGRLTPMMKNLSSQFWPIPAISTIYRATPLKLIQCVPNSSEQLYKVSNRRRKFVLYSRKISSNIQKCFLTLEHSFKFFSTVSNL